jgi:hypothetical protein
VAAFDGDYRSLEAGERFPRFTNKVREGSGCVVVLRDRRDRRTCTLFGWCRSCFAFAQDYKIDVILLAFPASTLSASFSSRAGGANCFAPSREKLSDELPLTRALPRHRGECHRDGEREMIALRARRHCTQIRGMRGVHPDCALNEASQLGVVRTRLEVN